MSSTPSPSDNAIIDVLNRFPEVQLAILFGSCAKGDATADSDLDLAVQADQPLDAELSIRLIGEIAEQLGRPVDLIDLRTAGEPLLGEVLKGRRLIGSDTSYARLITRHLLDAADFLPYRERILAERRKQWTAS
jgi:predicted nucleotidyltransferase